MSRYTGHAWANGQAPAINATNLLQMEQGILSASSGVFNPSDFGAKFDGTTDDTAAIQAAITAAGQTVSGLKFQNSSGAFQAGNAAPGGGVVQLPPGAIVTGPLTLTHRCWLRGSGLGTVLKRKSGSSGPLIRNQRDSSVHAAYCTVSDLTIDGGWDFGTTPVSGNHGIAWYGNANFNYQDPLDEDYDQVSTIRNVQIIRVAGNGIHTEGSGANMIQSVKIRTIGGVGIQLGQDNHVDQADVGWTTVAGIKIDGDDCRVTDTKCWYSNGPGFYITSDSGAMSGCSAQDCINAGLRLENAYGWSIAGFMTDSCSRTQVGVFPGIDVQGSQFCSVYATVRNRYTQSPNGPTTTALRLANYGNTDPTGNTIEIVQASGVWGVANGLMSGSAPHGGGSIRINGQSV